ncbi:WD40 repeat domain-containing protein [Streptomyces virginiae]|uniref:WD40 repeat domain-containing protein n=1 Tax=Streptomyces virginiae TaxID=1961 RepID=UPI00386E0FEA|nr:WD40 repeat domain-containing protein [Streptomyces virginiae]
MANGDRAVRQTLDSDDEAALLLPLAFAEGVGLPLTLWVVLARALSGHPWTAQDVSVFRDRAGELLVETQTPEGVAYRLRARGARSGERQTQRAVTSALLAEVPLDGDDGHRDWPAAAPYIVDHLAAHAAAAGALDEILEDAEYLVHAAPQGLLRALNIPGSSQGTVRRSIYRASVHVHATASLPERRDILAVDAARHGETGLALELSRGRPWRPRWATGTMVHPALRFTKTGLGVDAAACTVIDGRPHAVTGCYDANVRVWDLVDGTERLVITEDDGVYALDCVEIDGRPHVVTGTCSGSLRVWDLDTGAERFALGGHKGWIHAVGCTVIDGRPHAVTAGEDCLVRLWDLVDGSERARMPGHTEEVRAVAFTEVAGRPVAVTGGYDNTVRLWDLEDGVERAVLTGHTSAVYAVACTMIDGIPHAITGSGGEHAARVWCLTDGSQRAVLGGHTSWISAVSCFELGGRPHVLTAGGDCTVHVWDLAEDTERAVLTGHHGYVDVLASTEIDGRPYAVSGGHSAPPRVWDLGDAALPAGHKGHTGTVQAVGAVEIDGRPHVVTGGDTTIRVWDLADGSERGTLPHGHRVEALACTTVHDSPYAAVGGCCGVARVWDLAAGTVLRDLPGPDLRVETVAWADVNGRARVVTSDQDRTIRVWDLAEDVEHPLHSDRTRSAVRAMEPVTVDGRPHLVTGSDDAALRLWRLTEKGRRVTATVHTGHHWIRALAGTVLEGCPHALTVGGNDTAVQVWDLTDGTLRSTLAGHPSGVLAVACTTQDDRTDAITLDGSGTVHVWDLAPARLREKVVLPTRAQCMTAVGQGLVIGMGDDVVVLDRNR